MVVIDGVLIYLLQSMQIESGLSYLNNMRMEYKILQRHLLMVLSKIECFINTNTQFFKRMKLISILGIRV